MNRLSAITLAAIIALPCIVAAQEPAPRAPLPSTYTLTVKHTDLDMIAAALRELVQRITDLDQRLGAQVQAQQQPPVPMPPEKPGSDK